MRDKIKCNMIFFDAGMTIIHPVPHYQEGIRQVLEENGLFFDNELIEREAKRSIRHIQDEINSGRRYCVNDREDREFWGDIYERIVKSLGFDEDPRELGFKIYEFYQQPHSFDLFDDTLPALEQLRDMGFRLGVISNFSTILHSVLGERGVRDLFDTVVVSATEGYMKPDTEIFELALENADVMPEQAVMVGDNLLDDIRGALAAGITPVLLDRFGKSKEENIARICSLDELPDLLELDDDF